MNRDDFEFLLFAHTPEQLQAALAAGLPEVMIDCEWRGKADRQSGADTDISHTHIDSVANAAALPPLRANCRINGFGAWTAAEIDETVAAGAHRVFLPMASTPQEVEHYLRLLNGRARAAILIETQEAVEAAAEIATLPLDAVYVGLNDLAISRGRNNIFEAVLDGTVEQLRECFADTAFGFGGVTVLGGGHPVPGQLLLAEMQRLQCQFGFLRRSYYRDVQGRDARAEIDRLREYWRMLSQRDANERHADQRMLHDCLRALLAAATAS